MHNCPECGFEHDVVAADPEPAAPVVVDQGPNENDVKIAEIEAAARVESDRMYTEQRGAELESEVAGLRGELAGMREALERVAPAPEPEPVVVVPPEPAPAPAGPDVPAPPVIAPEEKPKKSKGDSGWFAGYR